MIAKDGVCMLENMIDRRNAAFALVLGLALAAGACTNGESADAPAKESRYLAMARGEVDVEGGLVQVTAPRDGRIVEVDVEDGDAVKAGAVLAKLDARRARSALEVADAGRAEAEARVAVLKAKLPAAQDAAKRVGEAASAGAATGQSADESATTVAVLKAEIAAADAAVKVARAELDAARTELDALTLAAPVAGRIVHRSAHVGDVVSTAAATELFRILPDRPRIVRAELNETYVDRIKPGMRAEIVRDTDEGTAYPAKVLRVGEVFGPSRLTDDPVERAGAHDVTCVLALEGGEFRIGQRVLVRFTR
jgi:RND family efflux transporter MFP subunit